ncbi:VOC family protein [Spirillospora albida]|uniref:VOC family protein n=1 Tax=Spirillospora albida TaxID=58123 RepID=UPI0012F7F950|nr:VOC family protein [Spirillospora albida]
MHVMQLGLPVRDEQRSRRFYETYFEFTSAHVGGHGTIIVRNADGFELALHGGQDAEPPAAFLRFAFRLFAPEEVEDLLSRMQTDGVDIVEQYEDPGYVSFTCTDPDGHRIEAYWEASGALTGF